MNGLSVSVRYPRQGNLYQQVRGQWADILATLSPELSPALERIGRSGPCPVHGGKDGFRFFRNAAETGGGVCNTCGTFSNGFQLLAWLSGDNDIKAAYRRVSEYVNHGSAFRIATPPPVDPKVEAARKAMAIAYNTKLADTLWQRAQARSTLLMKYLMGRGLIVPPASMPAGIRTAQGVPYFYKESRTYTYHPAILALIQHPVSGERLGLHRIYLHQQDGMVIKAPMLEDPKRTLLLAETLNGGAVLLGKASASQPLIVCEGLETGWALHLASGGLPVQCGLTAVGLENMVIPPQVRHILIGADYDLSERGKRAAALVTERATAAGLTVDSRFPDDFARAPQAKGIDWLDAFNQDPDRVNQIWQAFYTPAMPDSTNPID